MTTKSPMIRFEAIRKENGLTQKEFCEKLDMRNTTYSSIKIHAERGESEKKPITKNMYLMCHKVFGINIKWLETGLGPKHFNQSSDVKKNNYVQLLEIPLLPILVQAGTRSSNDNIVMENDLDYMSVPDLGLPRSMDLISFEVQSDSMLPDIKPRDYVICSKFPLDTNLELYIGKKFVIITKEYEYLLKVMTKFDQATHMAEFSSKNPAFKPINIKLTEVRELWKVEQSLIRE